MIKIIFFTFILLPFLSFTQDWPIYDQDWYDRNIKDWPSNYKDLNDTCDVIPLGVDFGLCAMPLGWALTDSGCVVLSGCDWIGSNGVDYTNSFFSSSYECNSACLQDTVVMLSCIDSNLIDLSLFCPQVIDPVCGCDSITYQNSCIATSYYGISSFYPGSCITGKINMQEVDPFIVYPNPSNGIFSLKPLELGSAIRFYNVYGQLVFTTEALAKELHLNLQQLPKGCYLFTINNGVSQKLLIE